VGFIRKSAAGSGIQIIVICIPKTFSVIQSGCSRAGSASPDVFCGASKDPQMSFVEPARIRFVLQNPAREQAAPSIPAEITGWHQTRSNIKFLSAPLCWR